MRNLRLALLGTTFFLLVVYLQTSAFGYERPTQPRLQACRTAVEYQIDQVDGIPWYLRSQVRNYAVRDLRDIQRGKLTLDRAAEGLYLTLRERRMEEGWALYLRRQYRQALTALVEDRRCG